MVLTKELSTLPTMTTRTIRESSRRFGRPGDLEFDCFSCVPDECQYVNMEDGLNVFFDLLGSEHILKGCVSVPGGPRPQVRGQFSDLEGRKGHRLL